MLKAVLSCSRGFDPSFNFSPNSLSCDSTSGRICAGFEFGFIVWEKKADEFVPTNQYDKLPRLFYSESVLVGEGKFVACACKTGEPIIPVKTEGTSRIKSVFRRKKTEEFSTIDTFYTIQIFDIFGVYVTSYILPYEITKVATNKRSYIVTYSSLSDNITICNLGANFSLNCNSDFVLEDKFIGLNKGLGVMNSLQILDFESRGLVTILCFENGFLILNQNLVKYLIPYSNLKITSFSASIVLRNIFVNYVVEVTDKTSSSVVMWKLLNSLPNSETTSKKKKLSNERKSILVHAEIIGWIEFDLSEELFGSILGTEYNQNLSHLLKIPSEIKSSFSTPSFTASLAVDNHHAVFGTSDGTVYFFDRRLIASIRGVCYEPGLLSRKMCNQPLCPHVSNYSTKKLPNDCLSARIMHFEKKIDEVLFVNNVGSIFIYEAKNDSK